jgi:carbonic anhydrase/acetyltransferase-like protein (isoleucine patch superfamily)
MIRTFQGFKPTIPKSCVIEETGMVIGDVVFGEHRSL